MPGLGLFSVIAMMENMDVTIKGLVTFDEPIKVDHQWKQAQAVLLSSCWCKGSSLVCSSSAFLHCQSLSCDNSLDDKEKRQTFLSPPICCSAINLRAQRASSPVYTTNSITWERFFEADAKKRQKTRWERSSMASLQWSPHSCWVRSRAHSLFYSLFSWIVGFDIREKNGENVRDWSKSVKM